MKRDKILQKGKSETAKEKERLKRNEEKFTKAKKDFEKLTEKVST